MNQDGILNDRSFNGGISDKNVSFRGDMIWDSCQIGSRIWNEKWKITHMLQALCRELQL